MRQQFADLGRRDLYFLCKVVCFPEPADGKFHYNNQLHRELALTIQDQSFSKKLILIPRGHLKTTIATKGRAIQWAVQNPNNRILIINAIEKNAQRMLGHIENIFRYNALFCWLYQELIPDFNKTLCSASEFLINRTEMYSEPTFMAAGVGTALPSVHCTKMIKDDVVNDKNSATPELIESIIEWDASIIPLFDSPGDSSNEELMIGTPWANTDVYALKRADSEYATYMRHALENAQGEADYEFGQPIYPERFSRERLVKIRERIANDDLFYCQYMCDPGSGKGGEFKPEWIQFYDRKPANLEYSITLDPGGLRGRDSDFTGLTVVGVDGQNEWWVDYLVKERMNPREQIELLFNTFALYPTAHTVGIEEVAWQKSLHFFAEEEMRKRGIFLPLRALKTDTRIKKEMRIRGLIPRFSNHTIHVRRGISKALEDEMFKRVPNDDLVDALAYQLQVATTVPQAARKIQSINPFSIEEVLRELMHKNRGAGAGLESGLASIYEDTQPHWGQLKEERFGTA